VSFVTLSLSKRIFHNLHFRHTLEGALLKLPILLEQAQRELKIKSQNMKY